MFVEEAVRPVEMRRDFLRVRAREDKELEAAIGGREILDVYLSCVCSAHEYVRDQALADDKVRRCGLMGHLGYHGRRIMYADARREVAVILEGPRWYGNMVSDDMTVRPFARTDAINSSCVGPCPSLSTRNFWENNAENVLSKDIKSWAYFRRSNSY